MGGHGMTLLLPSVRAKLDHNPSHLVSHQTAPQILAGAPVTMNFGGTEVLVTIVIDNYHDIFFFVFGI